MEKNRGFSFIELLIVIVLISVIAVIALPNFLSTKERAIRASMLSDLRNIIAEQEIYYSSNNSFANNLTDLGNFKPSPNNTIEINSKSDSPKGWLALVSNSELIPEKICSVFIGVASDGATWPSIESDLSDTSTSDREIACSF